MAPCCGRSRNHTRTPGRFYSNYMVRRDLPEVTHLACRLVVPQAATPQRWLQSLTCNSKADRIVNWVLRLCLCAVGHCACVLLTGAGAAVQFTPTAEETLVTSEGMSYSYYESVGQRFTYSADKLNYVFQLL